MATTFELARRPYQSPAPLQESTIAAWERSRGAKLPEDYRRFLLKFNGGSLKPYTFDFFEPNWSEKVHALEVLFEWEEVLDRSQWDAQPNLRNTPPDRLAIGITTSELYVMLSISPERFGAIDLWPKNLHFSWGEDLNTVVTPLAKDFNAFLAGLHEDIKGETYHSFWQTIDNPAALRFDWP